MVGCLALCDCVAVLGKASNLDSIETRAHLVQVCGCEFVRVSKGVFAVLIAPL